jgi:O-antigen/teichoic acid export membrane protein
VIDQARRELDRLRRHVDVGYIKSAVRILLATGVGRGAMLASLLGVARVLGAHDFGLFTIIQATASLLTVAAGLGLTVAIPRAVGEARVTDPQAVGGIIVLGLVVVLAGGTTLGLMTFALAGQASTALHPTLAAGSLRTASLAIAAGTITPQLVYSLIAIDAVGKASIVTGVRGIVVGAATFVSAREGLQQAILGWSCGEAAVALLGVALLRSVIGNGTFRLWPIQFRRHQRLIWTLGLPSMLAGLTIQPAVWLAQLLLARTPGGLPAVGLFGVALRWNQALLLVPAAIAPIALPRLTMTLAAGDPAASRRLLRTAVAANIIPVSVLCGPVFLVALRTSPPFDGIPKSAATSLLLVLVLAAFPMALNNVMSQVALARLRIRLWLVSDVGLAVTLLVVSGMLVRRWGPVGLGAAYFAAYVVTCLLLLPVFKRSDQGSAALRLAPSAPEAR